MEDCIIKINDRLIIGKREIKIVYGLKKPIEKIVYTVNGSELYKSLSNIVEINGKKYYKSDRIKLNGDFKLIEI